MWYERVSQVPDTRWQQRSMLVSEPYKRVMRASAHVFPTPETVIELLIRCTLGKKTF